MTRSTSVFKREDGTAVVPAHFDHALSIPALPDHLLSSMIAYVMRACFKVLPSHELRSQVEMRIIKASRDNGLDVKSRILSWDRSKRAMRYKGVASTSMSSWFCILVMAAPVFEDVYEESQLSVFLLPKQLQALIAKLYKWPSRADEGKSGAHSDFRNPEHELLYQHAVAELAISFLAAARHEFTVNKDVGSILAKPITHGLLELVMTTVPLYSHARLCSEMVLEHTHQQFKRWLVNSTHPDANLTAMENAIDRDWLWRLSCLTNMYESVSATERAQAEMGMRRVVLGEVGVSVDLRNRAGEQVLKLLRDNITGAMESPVREMLEGSLEDNTAPTGSVLYE